MSTAPTKITRITKEHLTPLLHERGFTPSGTTFRRKLGDATQVVNVQRGSRNSAAEARFHLNGGVYLPALSAVIGAAVVDDPDEPSCHVRLRPQDAIATGQDMYVVTVDTDENQFGADAARDLAALLDRLDALTDPEAAVAYLATRKLTQYEQVLGWLLSRDELGEARRFVTGLHADFGDQRRWQIFADRLDAVSRHVRGDLLWREWIA